MKLMTGIGNLIWVQYVENNKAAGNDWFRLESNKEGTRWFGKCWHVQDLLKYEFEIEFDVSVIRIRTIALSLEYSLFVALIF